MKHERVSNSLDSFILFYEELEKKKVNKAKPVVKIDPALSKPKTTFKVRIASFKKTVRSRFNNILRKLKKQPKKARKLTKIQKKEAFQQKKRVILGIGLLFVVVSIGYSTYITRTFVDTDISVVALVPQVVFAVIILLKAFSKIYK